MQVPPTGVAPPRLRRVLGLWDLVFYGMILIQPTAPVPLYGVAESLSDGHFVTTILLAMGAMVITAISYGRMAAIYPSAGSAYSYVSQGLNQHLGFVVGWAMLLDYLLQPLLSAVWIATAIHARYLPGVPYAVTALLVVALITALNLCGVKSSARANRVLLSVMCAVIAAFVFLAFRFLYGGGGWSGLFSMQPFYDPHTFRPGRILGATSFAALTYIGFDGVTTLSEEVHNPRKNVGLATVLVCVFTGLLGGLLVYLGQRVWPEWRAFPNLETAFLDVCQRVGGDALFQAMGIVMLLAMLGSGTAGGLGAARLLYGMGRDGVLPRRVFGSLSPRTGVPALNILIIGAIAYVGAVTLASIGNAFEHAGELLNFGAFLAFMGVNAAAFRRLGMGSSRAAILPALGFCFCAVIWWNLNSLSKTAGGLWLLAGIAFLVYRTRGLREPLPKIDFSEC